MFRLAQFQWALPQVITTGRWSSLLCLSMARRMPNFSEVKFPSLAGEVISHRVEGMGDKRL